MGNQDRPGIDDDFTVTPAHPAPEQSPRALGDDQLTRRDDLTRDDQNQTEADRVPQKPDGRKPN